MKIKMSKIEKVLELSSWFNTYKNLLSEKQRLYLYLYLDEDLSLQEIANNFSISKNAVYDAIKKGIQFLTHLENELHYDSLKKKIIYFNDYYKNSDNKEINKMLSELLEE